MPRYYWEVTAYDNDGAELKSVTVASEREAKELEGRWYSQGASDVTIYPTEVDNDDLDLPGKGR